MMFRSAVPARFLGAILVVFSPACRDAEEDPSGVPDGSPVGPADGGSDASATAPEPGESDGGNVDAPCVGAMTLSVGTEAASVGSSDSPSALTVDGRDTPMDLDGTPRFGWQVHASTQEAYEIRVAATAQDLTSCTATAWSSGRVASARQTDVAYEGPALRPSTRYAWTVRTWAPGGGPSAWAPVATFGTGPGSAWTHSVPVWAPPIRDAWRDYRMTARVRVDAVALGLFFRAPDGNNGYMWQLRGDNNRLVPHRLVNGQYTVLQTVNLPTGTLAVGKEVEVTIEAVGTLVRTYIDGVQVHSIEDSTFSGGAVGVRTGRTEAFTAFDLEVTALGSGSSSTLLHTDFGDRDRTFACGTVTDGALSVPRGVSCLSSGASIDWAFLRRSFELRDQPIAWATAFATADSPAPSRQYVYKLYLNGRFVGLGPTQPIADETRYDGFDVTDLLVSGATNTLGAIAYTTRGQALQVELWVRYADGTEDVFGSDETWRAWSGDFVFPSVGSIGTSYYAAPREDFDARRFPYGFSSPGFDDSSWSAAAVRAPFARLVATPTPKVAQQYHPPARIVEKGPGHYFVDFGRTWVGGVHYAVEQGVENGEIEVRFGEVTQSANTVRYQLNTGNVYRDVYTTRSGPQTFETWGMRVFRYVEIIGAPEPVTSENLQALALVHPFDPRAATFSASDPALEEVWELSRNTIESLNVDFYTDSWTRERTNYEADAYLQLLSSLYLMNDVSLGRYSFDYFESRRTWPTEWPLYVILAVHDAWKHTGATRQLEEQYDSLRAKLPDAWFDESSHLIRKVSGSDGCNSRTDCDIVDWPATQRDGYVFREHNTVVNALAFAAYRDFSEIALALGHEDDAAMYAARAAALREAINRSLFDDVSGRYDDGLDGAGTPTGHHALHASAFPLAFGIPDEADAGRVADYLASRGMVCSVYCAPFLIGGLYEAGRDRAAMDLLTGDGIASWRHMIALGAGATMEAWDPSMKGNLTYSHPWAASPAFLIPSGLFGITPLETGYARFQVRPRPGTLGQASITVPTVRGTIGVAFESGATGGLRLVVRVPGNTQADVYVPVPEGTTSVLIDDVSEPVTTNDGYARLPALDFGCHIIRTSRDDVTPLDPTTASVCGTSPSAGR